VTGAPGASTIRVLLADDEQLMRTGLRMILEATDDIEVVGEAGDGREAVDLVMRLRPAVAVLDVRMPVLDGLAATREIFRLMKDSAPKVIVLTTFDLDEHVHEALVAGASGFLLKDVSAAGLGDAVRAVAAGEALLAPQVTRRLIEEYRNRPRRPPVDALEELTDRERDVFRACVSGMSNREIADSLHVAETTVKTYVSRLLALYGCRDRVQLVIRGYALGLGEQG
jgi:DNA-binding NarL/FixJ family response regulator